jgi:hypothetical protein
MRKLLPGMEIVSIFRLLIINQSNKKIKVMYTNIQQAIAAVESAYPSIFTKQDVIKLLNNIDIKDEEPIAVNVDELTDAVETLIDHFDPTCMVDYDSIELSISYDRRIDIESVDVDLEDLKTEVTVAIQEYFKKNS